MTRRYFGTDGVRAKVGSPKMNANFVLKLGWAAGKVLAKAGTKSVLIGKDTRISGYMLEAALEAGFSSAGVDVILTGPLPTPGVAYLTSTFRAEAGVVISASHNPYYDNGIKFFSSKGIKLTDEQETEIEFLLHQALVTGEMSCVESEYLGKAKRITSAAGRYIEYCKSTFSNKLSLAGMKIVVDSANGAAYQIAPKVFEELGAKVISINDQPNGTNINDQCGATHLSSLQNTVLDQAADVGIALDGDADRIMMVDNHGRVIDGDQILYILARDWQQSGELQGGVVGTLMSNLGLELGLAELGIPFERANVGDRYVVERLHANNWQLGGENSGHVLSLKHSTTGDGIVAALLVLKVMAQRQQSLATLANGMKMLPQVLINVRFNEGENPVDHASVKAAVRDAEQVMGTQGRVLLRKSGTEPLIRVMVEAADESLAKTQAQRIANQVKQVGQVAMA